jgi:hypothetical protein
VSVKYERFLFYFDGISVFSAPKVVFILSNSDLSLVGVRPGQTYQIANVFIQTWAP